MEGNSQLAIGASYRIAEKIDTVIMRDPSLGTLQHYWTIPLYVLVKFAEWEEILSYPKPAADLHYPLVVWHYARGMAWLGQNQMENAKTELAKLRTQMKMPAIQELTVWDINSIAHLTAIAEKVLEGEMAAKEGDFKTAV